MIIWKIIESNKNTTKNTINSYIVASDVDNLVKLMRNTNFKLLLDLNLQLRYGIQWDPTNAADLLGYVSKMKYHDVFNFELGNGMTEEFSQKMEHKCT